jgi:hypothetical protein
MVKPRFGRLEKVALQDIWNADGDEFLQWLSQPESLAMLGEILGFELKLQSLEPGTGVGDAHLLCREPRSNYSVLIENPVGVTEEAHLGKLMAHAASYSPVHVLWMAGQVQESHRGVLDWLNQVTDQTVNLFGMEIVFWRIGESAYAPKFNLVAAPQGFNRAVMAPTAVDHQPAAPISPAAPPPPAAAAPPPPDAVRAPAAAPPPPASPVPLEQASPVGMAAEVHADDGNPLPAEPPEEMLATIATGLDLEEDEPISEPPASAEGSARSSGLFQKKAANFEARGNDTLAGRAASALGTAPHKDPPAQAADNQGQRTSSGMLRQWQSGDTTVTPSGMLQRLRMSDGGEIGSGALRRPVTGDLTDLEALYLEFWTRFWEEVVQWGSELPPERPMSQGWVTFPIGRENFYIIAFINADHNLAGMGLVMEGPDSSAYFHLLRQDKEEIETEVGSVLDWRELPAKEESHIYLHKRDVDPHERQQWGEYHRWFAETLETFTHVLGTRVRTLNASDYWDEEAIYKRI